MTSAEPRSSRQTEVEDSVREVDALLSIIDEQERTIARLRSRRIPGDLLRHSGGRFAAWLFFGSGLRTSFARWNAKMRCARSPLDIFSEESAELGTALVRRFVRVGIFGLLIAALPTLLLLWQNIILQRQVTSQIETDFLTRRAQLLATIYDCEEVTKVGGTECRPKAHPRARAEAVEAFIEIESDHKDLFVDLAGADLSGIDLHLLEPKLAMAVFRGADLSGVRFFKANLFGAYLQGARLHKTRFDQSFLPWAKLRGTDLSTTIGLTQLAVDVACGDETTKLPPGLTRPAHWSPPDPKPEDWSGCPSDDDRNGQPDVFDAEVSRRRSAR